MVDDPLTTRRRSYPLFALFLLLTVCAILAALLAPTARAIGAGHLAVQSVASGIIAGAIFLSVIGAGMGWANGWGVGGFFYGAVAGGIIGVIAGALSFTPRTAGGQIAMLTVIGSMTLVLIAASMRVLRGQR